MKKSLQRFARTALRPLLDRLPARWRFAAYSRAIRCEPELSDKFVFKLAETREELEACFRLLHDAYVDAGFMKPAPSGLRVTVYHALPTTSTLLCRHGDRVVGTVSLVRESAMGFPMQRIFDIASIREAGGNIAEVSALAIDRRFRSASGRILMPLLKFMYEYATLQFDTRHLVIAVNPRHIGFYEAILCFRRLKQRPVEHYDFVDGAPAVGAHLDLDFALTAFRRRYDGLPPEKNLYRYFTRINLPNIQWPLKRFYTTTDPIMIPALMDHFFNQRTQTFARLRLRELMLLHSIYDLPEFKSVLPPVPDDAPRSEMRRRTHRRFSVVCPGEFSTRQFGVRRNFDITVFECSASGFRARSTTKLPAGTQGTVIIELGVADWSVMAVTVLRLGSHDHHIALLRIDHADRAWQKFVNVLGKARTHGELEEATRFLEVPGE
ncbi:N-acyl amino acid synthase FeeM domain-containing protein [Denitromonas iodatirespirans]|uniref:N-acyl amino acid synthase FeeM catalytic core domain-containing protein n=1 Tax=Denitromonas iodatirespirans TaxID=2795389 RepID=A0A944DE26_DENI1|nr:hypothetical protein [Denitromonas iodatirespirans]MBT0963807.1 hypothetical protein [Denitromonas iodatirespirans]